MAQLNLSCKPVRVYLCDAVNAKLFAIRGSFIAMQNFQLSTFLSTGIAPTALALPGF
jgi:hypothetical protein